MQTLAMEGGRFDIALNPGEVPRTATNRSVSGVATPAPPAAVGPRHSGGELARLSLALSVIASQAARVPT